VNAIKIAAIQSPVGELTVAVNESRVCMVHFGAATPDVTSTLRRWYPHGAVDAARDPAGAVSVLRRYFDGDLNALDEIAVELHGTPFQRSVWTALRGVKVGTTISYMELARRIGSPSAVRAVGAANGANPVAIVLPCHRIIGANGSLTGYGGGLDRKRWLLDHEGVGHPLFAPAART
jgi:methylated-DNA-[protein]-cysteine S-methyltransferase